jgi:hypothetical protein
MRIVAMRFGDILSGYWQQLAVSDGVRAIVGHNALARSFANLSPQFSILDERFEPVVPFLS